jgi:hypothetical protein
VRYAGWRPDLAADRQDVTHEVHRPPPVCLCRHDPWPTIDLSHSLPALPADRQSELRVNPVHAPVIEAAPFSSDHQMRPPIPVAWYHGRELRQPHHQPFICLGDLRRISLRGPADADQFGGSSLAQSKAVPDSSYRVVPGRGPQNILDSRSLRACFSSVNSATVAFSQRSSCSSSLRRRASLRSVPPALAFHWW